MGAEILSDIPTSGAYIEKHFGEHFNGRLWVKFTDNDFEEWMGCFARSSYNGLNLVVTDELNRLGFVVAGGHGYLVDIDKRAIIVELEEQPAIESAVRTEQPDYFIAGTYYSIYVLNETGMVKEIRPEQIVDGIYFKSQCGNKAIGELATAENQYDRNVDFEFDLTTFELQLNYRKKEGLIRRIWNQLTNLNGR